MPPPINLDENERQGISASNQRTERRVHTLLRPVYSWAHFNRMNQALAQMMSLSDGLQLGAFFAGFDTLSDLYNLGTSQESESDELSSTTSDNLVTEQRGVRSNLFSETNNHYEDDPVYHECASVEEYLPTYAYSMDVMYSSEENEESESENSSLLDSDFLDGGEENSDEVVATQDHGRWPGRNEDTTEAQEDSDRLSSDAASVLPERLQLSSEARIMNLSSALQDFANANTIVDINQYYNHLQGEITGRNTGGIPLRRQNAIRRTSSLPISPVPKEGIQYMKKSLRSILRAMADHDPSFGACPLYTGKHIWGKKYFPILTSHCPHHEPESLFEEMDLLLKTRQRRGHSSHEEYFKPDLDDLKHRLKRKCTVEPSSNKRRKKSNAVKPLYKSNTTQMHLKRGDMLRVALLSKSNKNRILDVLPSTFICSGSSFELSTDAKNSAKNSGLELSFTHVSHNKPNLTGFFRLVARTGNEGSTVMDKFMLALIGSAELEDGRKYREVLKETFKVIRLSEFVSPKSSAIRLQIPFSGTFIDFKNQDLRYSKTKLVKKMLNKTKNESIRFQLSEWLEIKPFSYLKETFFLQQVRFALRCLTYYTWFPKKHRRTVYDFCKNIVEESCLLTEDFELVRKAKIPVIEQSFASSNESLFKETRRGKDHRLGSTLFTRRWNKELCNKLADYAECTESCLLNLQLNYVLFTVEVDLRNAVQQILDLAFQISPKAMSATSFTKIKKQFSEDKISPAGKYSRFLCSLDRKTGKLELRRARSEDEYKPPVSRLRFVSYRSPSSSAEGSRNPSISHEDSQHLAEMMSSECTPEHKESEVIYGVPKRGNFSASEWGGDATQRLFV